jgi:excinuclease ABC subunit C
MGEVLKELRRGPVNIKVPVRGMKKRQVELARKNALMNAAEHIARQEKKNRLHYSVAALQEDLRLDHPPRRIEAFDISHLSGTDTVASMAVFIDGRPRKNEYRKYNIRSVDGIDDYAAMREVVERRVRRLLDEKKELPDLFLIDGGKGQLNAALEALRKTCGSASSVSAPFHGATPDKPGPAAPVKPVIGLAKKLEEIFIPGMRDPVRIPKTSASLKLIRHIRNESHRFAITFQRSKRKKYVTTTWLDEIPGVGPKTREKLLKTYKTPAAVRSASLESLRSCLGPALAQKIHHHICSADNIS